MTIFTSLAFVNEWRGGIQGIAVGYEVSASLTSTGLKSRKAIL
jgi:hypothetical protein